MRFEYLDIAAPLVWNQICLPIVILGSPYKAALGFESKRHQVVNQPMLVPDVQVLERFLIMAAN